MVGFQGVLMPRTEKLLKDKEKNYSGQNRERGFNFAGNFSNDCGNRWMKASPNKLPTARLTMTKMTVVASAR